VVNSIVLATLVASAASVVAALVRNRAWLMETWRWESTVVFAVGWLLSLEHLAASLAGQYAVTVDRFTGAASIVYGPVAGDARVAGQIAVVCIGLIAIVRSLGKSRPLNSPGVWLLLLLLFVLFSSIDAPLSIDWPGMAGSLLIAALAVLMRPGPAPLLGAALYIATLVPVSVALLLYREDAASVPCVVKCGPLGVLYTGTAIYGNGFGLILVLGLPFVLLAFSGRLRTITVIGMGVSLLVTGSRTSIAVAAAVLALFLIVIWFRRSDPKGGRALIPPAVLGAALTSLAAPIALGELYSPRFTGRAHLWGKAIDHWELARWFGHGQRGWAEVDATYSPHNQWMEALVAAGLIGVVLFAGFLVALYRNAEDPLGPGLVIFTALTAGVLERPWSLTTPSWFLLAACLCATGVLAAPEPAPEQAETRDSRRQRSGQSTGQVRRAVPPHPSPPN
jgi:O-antigen ligase